MLELFNSESPDELTDVFRVVPMLELLNAESTSHDEPTCSASC